MGVSTRPQGSFKGGIIMIPTKDTLLSPYVQNWNTRVTATPAAFGLSATQATALDAVVVPYVDAQAALVNARAAGIRNTSLTTARTTARSAMLPLLRELYAFVQASLTVSDANKDLLGVKVRSSSRTPQQAPGAVSNFKVELNGDGSLTLKWKSDNHRIGGTTYQVWRKIGDAGFTYCGGTGTKEFMDMTVPALTSSITYQIQAVRSTAVGPWAQFNVNFAVGGGSSVTQSTPVQIAA
jgi:hypothetical protein